MEEKKYCEECGMELENPHPLQKLCRDCAARRHAEENKARRRRQGDELEKQEQTCSVCGAKFHARSVRKYCPACLHEKQSGEMHARMAGKHLDPVTLEERTPYTMKGAYRREDGVLVIPRVERKDEVRRVPRKPPKKADPESLEVILYELYQENEARRGKGQKSLSYGQFVARRGME